MVEELKLEKIYAQRGIELITPAAGTRILDRLINQKTPNVIAISADWMRARRAGLGGQLPPMFSELGTAETSPDAADSESSILDFLSACPEADRLDVVAGHVRQIAAAVFELAVTDIGPDDALDDIGLDSMMAMDFRLRVNAMFAIDLPLLELLRGVSVNSLAVRILAELQLAERRPGRGHRAAIERPHRSRRRRRPIDRATVRGRATGSAGRTREAAAEQEAEEHATRESPRCTSGVCRSPTGNYRPCGIWTSTSDTAKYLRSSGPTARASRRPSRSSRDTESAIPDTCSVLGEDPGTAGRSWRAKIGIVLQEVSDAGMLTVV